VQEKSDQDMNQWKKNKKRSNLQILVCNCHSCQAQHFLPDENYRSSDLFDQNLSLWGQNSTWQDVARATKCRHGGNEVSEAMFFKIICRHGGDKCPAWREKAVWGKWMMTWQKPTGKESWWKGKYCKSIKTLLLISETLLSDIRSF